MIHLVTDPAADLPTTVAPITSVKERNSLSTTASLNYNQARQTQARDESLLAGIKIITVKPKALKTLQKWSEITNCTNFLPIVFSLIYSFP